MVRKRARTGYRVYWTTWGALLVLTLAMVGVDQAPLARPLFVSLMVTAMLAKAGLIAANFMHLRLERAALALMVAVGLLVNGAVLFLLILPDAYRLATVGVP